ncbi:anthranilate phosphoribosyltransferase [Francisella sp. Scap27]|nr:anthranilate phosphoribosyltransferase [Francisella sp. Scap27]
MGLQMIDIQKIAHKLYDQKNLDYDEGYKLFEEFINGNIPLELQTSILIALKIKKETPTEIAAAAKALLSNSKAFPQRSYDIVDIVGTGGDGSNTFNISTTAAIVTAALGYKVAKHGSRSVSSKSGSFDLLESFGVNIEASPEETSCSINTYNIGFLYAPFYNDGFKYVKKARSILKTRTIFNILGPLINPSRPNKALIGVYSEELILPMAKTLIQLGMKRAIVVYGSGLDEVAIHDKTFVAEIENGNITEYILEPEDFGISRYSLDSLKGGTPSENKIIIENILKGNAPDPHNYAVAINIALMMKLYNSPNLKDNTKIVIKKIKSGDCYSFFNKLLEDNL